MQFAAADGFRLRESYRDPRSEIGIVKELIENHTLDRPPISEPELKSREKSDSFIKLVALLQLLWFTIRTSVRLKDHFQITAIEIMTLAFALCSILVYAFCFNQPQDIEYPILLDGSSTPDAEFENAPPLCWRNILLGSRYRRSQGEAESLQAESPQAESPQAESPQAESPEDDFPKVFLPICLRARRHTLFGMELAFSNIGGKIGLAHLRRGNGDYSWSMGHAVETKRQI